MCAGMNLTCGWLEDEELQDLRYTRNNLQGARRRRRERHWAGEAERPVKRSKNREKWRGEDKAHLHSAISEEHVASCAVENPYFVCNGGEGVMAVVWDGHWTHIHAMAFVHILFVLSTPDLCSPI